MPFSEGWDYKSLLESELQMSKAERWEVTTNIREISSTERIQSCRECSGLTIQLYLRLLEHSF